MERLTYRDSDGRALLTNKGMKIYCSTQATADVLCKYEEIIGPEIEISPLTEEDVKEDPELENRLKKYGYLTDECGR